jgi:glycine/D-amino acid oxidase-like deaminating enzyme
MPIAPHRDPEQVAASYTGLMAPPALLSVEAACALEPLLNPEAIAAALLVNHGHVSPEATVKAYQQAFLRLGGVMETAQVTGFSAAGVSTTTGSYSGKNTVVCAGGMSRSLLQQAGLSVRLYYSQAEIIETPPVDLRLQAIVTPAELQRFNLEAQAAKNDALWDQPGHEVVPPILDVGVVQFRDGSLRIGQFTRALTDPQPQVDAAQSEAALRSGIGEILPALRDVPGQWHNCLVAFSGDSLPLIGAISEAPYLHLFTGFSNAFVLLPPLARRFAQQVVGRCDDVLAQMLPGRFDAEP